MSMPTKNAKTNISITKRVVERGEAGGSGVGVVSQNLVEAKPVASLMLTERIPSPADAGEEGFKR